MASLANLSDDLAAIALTDPTAAPHDMRIDEEAHLIRAVVRGVWTMDQADDYLLELGDLLDESRRRFGHARMLIDRRGRPNQPSDVADRLSVACAELFAGDDRLAVVVESSLAKARVRPLLPQRVSQAFLSETAAELWLTAWP